MQKQPAPPLISVVTPVYGCADCLDKLHERLVSSLSSITDNFEIIMVNDGSPDDAWATISRLGMHDARVKGIELSRNFGQHHAITAGLDHARGDWVVVMDCDLQDRPAEIIKLYNKAKEGFDVVFGRRAVRKDSFFKRLGSGLFYRVLSYFTDQKFDASISNFSIISRKVANAFVQIREQNRNYVLCILWMGFKAAQINIEHEQRATGRSSYTVRKLIYFAYDIIIAQSNKPLRLSITFGFAMAFSALAYGGYLVVRYLSTGVGVAGWTSTIVSIFLVGGILLANMGVLGVYLGKVFNEEKRRPIYVVATTINLNRNP